MSSPLFAKHAASYWQAGFSPLPLNGKAPIINKWSSYCDNLPKPETRAQWTLAHSDANIGLALGKEYIPNHRFGVLDVDDDRYVRVTQAIIGKASPMKRGKKGISNFVHFEKEAAKSTKFVSAEGDGAVDVLIGGKQTVIPPSIHPNTGQPYVWDGPPLLDWDLDDLPRISKQRLSILKLVVESADTAQILTGKSTHDAGLRLVGQLVRFADNDTIRAIVVALLPDNYQGNSLGELDGWMNSAREKGFDKVGTLPVDETAALIVAKELDPLKYTGRDGFLQYEAGHWKAVAHTEIQRRLKAHLLGVVGPKSQVSGILPGAERCLALNVEDSDFGKSQGKICLRNGTLDVASGELLAHNPDHRLRFALDIDWDPNAECPTYLEQIH